MLTTLGPRVSCTKVDQNAIHVSVCVICLEEAVVRPATAEDKSLIIVIKVSVGKKKEEMHVNKV